MNRLWLSLMISAFVFYFLGVAAVAFPYLDTPNSIDCPNLASLRSAYTHLGLLSEEDPGDHEPAGHLRPDNEGYPETYDVLRTLDPGLPTLESSQLLSPTHRVLGIVAKSILSIGSDSSPRRIPMTSVYVKFAGGEARPICQLTDLKWRIDSLRTRTWSTIGLVLTFVALMLSSMASICDHRRSSLELARIDTRMMAVEQSIASPVDTPITDQIAANNQPVLDLPSQKGSKSVSDQSTDDENALSQS